MVAVDAFSDASAHTHTHKTAAICFVDWLLSRFDHDVGLLIGSNMVDTNQPNRQTLGFFGVVENPKYFCLEMHGIGCVENNASLSD